MDRNKIVGIIIIIVILLSLILVGYHALNSTIDKENIIQIEQSMDESELNQSLLEGSEDSNLTTININLNQKTGGSKIVFADNTTEIYKVISKDDNNFTTIITPNQENGTLGVNIDSNCSENTIILSNKYNYNISGRIVAGGLTANLNNASKVSDLSANVTAGGVQINFNGGTLNSSNIRISTGGLDITGQPVGESHINSEIEVGGVNIQLQKPVADIFSSIDVGGINPGDYHKVAENEYKGNEFDSSENKLILNSTVIVGGLNTQKVTSTP